MKPADLLSPSPTPPDAGSAGPGLGKSPAHGKGLETPARLVVSRFAILDEDDEEEEQDEAEESPALPAAQESLEMAEEPELVVDETREMSPASEGESQPEVAPSDDAGLPSPESGDIPLPTSPPDNSADAVPEASQKPPAKAVRVPAPKPSGKNTTPVRELVELIEHFAQWLPQDPDLRWSFPPVPHSDPLPSLELDVEGRRQAFTPVYVLKPSQAALDKVKVPAGEPPPLLVTTELTSRLAEMCRQKRLSALDLNGRALLRAPGLLVDRPPLPGRAFKFELEPRNIFIGKSARILRTLLTDRTRQWSQRDLSGRTGASAGLISRIVQHLITQGFMEKRGAREFRLTDVPELLEAWGAADHFSQRTRTVRFAVPETSPVELAHRVRAWARAQGVQIAFTQHLAASLRHSGVEPQVTAAYVSQLPDAATLAEWDIQPVTEDGELWLHVPDDEGVFLETQSAFRFVPILQQKINLDLPLASDAQIYLDLLKTEAQGPEQAVALRKWSGFCIP